MHKFVGALDISLELSHWWHASLRVLRASNFALLGKIVKILYTAKLSKRKILPYGTGNLQQRQLQRTKNDKNVVNFLSTQ